MGYVIRLANGQYFDTFLGGIPRSTPDQEDAEQFTSRGAALAKCAQGPAAFFDRAAIIERLDKQEEKPCS